MPFDSAPIAGWLASRLHCGGPQTFTRPVLLPISRPARQRRERSRAGCAGAAHSSRGRPWGDALAAPDIMATLPELLKTTVELDGSDLHLTTSAPPTVRVHGKLVPLK